ncbi:MAG TPA: LysE family transporter [Ignavibacteriaceae bacterium]|nr:LysE family transporter [Ignavibacteriaceae bacterium]
MITYLILGITYAFAAAIQPGPFQTFIISQTLKNGWKKTLPSAIAPILSDIPVIIIVLLLLTNLPVWFLRILQTGGGLLLLYLAYQSFKSFLNFDKPNDSVTDRTGNTFWKAVLVNILNPNPYIGWSLIMGPLFLKGYHEASGNGIALIVSFYVTIVICQMGIIVLFGLARNLGPKITHITLGIASAGLAAFGIYLLYQGLIN